MCSLDGYPEMKGTGVEEDDYVLCGVNGYPEMKGTGVEEAIWDACSGMVDNPMWQFYHFFGI